MLDTEAAQHAVEPGEQRGSAGAAAARTVGTDAGGQHEVVAVDDAAEQTPEHALRGTLAVAVGDLHQGAARADERAQLLGGAVGIGVVAPGHGAQADPRHPQPAVAHPSLQHGGHPRAHAAGRYGDSS